MKRKQVLSRVITCVMLMTSILTIIAPPMLAAPIEEFAPKIEEYSAEQLLELNSEKLHEYISKRIPIDNSDAIYPEAAYRPVGDTFEEYFSEEDALPNIPSEADTLWREEELARKPYADEMPESPRPSVTEIEDYLSGKKEIIMQLDPEATFESAQTTESVQMSINDTLPDNSQNPETPYADSLTSDNESDTADDADTTIAGEDASNADITTDSSNVSVMAAATPYLSVYNITKTSITVSATFPVYSAWFNNINLYDHSNQSWSKIAGDCSSGTYTKTGLKPFTKYTVELQWWDNGARCIQKDIYTLGNTPNFTSTVAQTTITVNATFPGTYNNRILYYNGGWKTIAPDGSVQSGTYTLSNLTPGTTYTVEFWYWDWPNERWSVTTRYITTTYIPETWQTTETAHMKFSFEPNDISKITSSNYTTWKNRMEYAYVDMAEFAGATPFSGQKNRA